LDFGGIIFRIPRQIHPYLQFLVAIPVSGIYNWQRRCIKVFSRVILGEFQAFSMCVFRRFPEFRRFLCIICAGGVADRWGRGACVGYPSNFVRITAIAM